MMWGFIEWDCWWDWGWVLQCRVWWRGGACREVGLVKDLERRVGRSVWLRGGCRGVGGGCEDLRGRGLRVFDLLCFWCCVRLMGVVVGVGLGVILEVGRGGRVGDGLD